MSSIDEKKPILIEETEIFCAKNDSFKDQFHIILQAMWKLKLVKGEQILNWGKAAGESI